MKSKIVLWGKDSTDTRSLIAMELKPEESKIDVWVFAEPLATDELGEDLLFKWSEDKEFDLPEGFQKYETALSVAESILPDGITADKPEIVQRTQTEWQFMVLSAKLNEAYKSELEDLEDRIVNLEAYDVKAWDDLKNFWDKVREQMRERNLFKDHATALKERTNYLFDKMKGLRTALDAEFKKEAEATYNRFAERLSEIEERVAKNINLYNIFEELKALQREFHNSKFTREMRNEVWKRLDSAFKLVKEKRFGPNNNSNDKTARRFEGLMNAIKKMEISVGRDQEELDFQNKRINSVHTGQLEAQLRQAKLKMIEERISSKQAKLNDMYKTKEELEEKMEQNKAREEAEAAKQKERAAKKAAQEAKAAEAKPTPKEVTPEVEAPKVEETVEETVEEPKVETPAEEAVETPKVEEAVEEVKAEEKVEDTPEEEKTPQE